MVRMQWTKQCCLCTGYVASALPCLRTNHLSSPHALSLYGACADEILYDSIWYRVFTRRVLHCTAIFTGHSCTEIRGSALDYFFCNWTLSWVTECSIRLQTLLISKTRFNIIRQSSRSVPSGSLLLSVSVPCMHFSLPPIRATLTVYPNLGEWNIWSTFRAMLSIMLCFTSVAAKECTLRT